MDWNKFKDLFHESWHPKMKPLIESRTTDNIFAFLKGESSKGKKIAPASPDLFKCFTTPLDEIKCVIVAMCPYHTIINGKMLANGFPMDCENTGKLSPSLENFYNGIEKEIGFSPKWEKPASLSYLRSQGVFFYNVALTTEIDKAGSHMEIWKDFSKYIIAEIIAPTNVPVIFLGNEAQKFEQYLMPMQWSWKITHPAAASYKGEDWKTEGVFTKVNQILKDTNGYNIHWLYEEVPW